MKLISKQDVICILELRLGDLSEKNIYTHV
jgi:hypothetical protein